MEPQEMDKLIGDIQEFLKNTDAVAPSETGENESEEMRSGDFISQDARRKIPAFLKYSRIASHAVEALTIILFTGIIINPAQSWPKTLMLLCGVLLFGIFMITALLSYQARIHLLLKIEENTRSIAASKAKIAEALEKIHIE